MPEVNNARIGIKTIANKMYIIAFSLTLEFKYLKGLINTDCSLKIFKNTSPRRSSVC